MVRMSSKIKLNDSSGSWLHGFGIFICIALLLVFVAWCMHVPSTIQKEQFQSEARNNPLACRLYKYFDNSTIPELFVIDRNTGKARGPIGAVPAKTQDAFLKADQYKYTYEEAVGACSKAPRFRGFVMLTVPLDKPEASSGAAKRTQVMFYDDSMMSKLQDINPKTDTEYLVQHVYHIYPGLDECATDSYCSFPALTNMSKLGYSVMPSVLKAQTFEQAKDYCSSMNGACAGFTFRRDGKGSPIFYQGESSGYSVNLINASKSGSITKDDISKDLVFYMRSTSPCRTSVDRTKRKDDWTQWWRDRAVGEDVSIHPMVSNEDPPLRICEDNTDTACFLDNTETQQAAYALQLSLAEPQGIQDDPYKIYKDENNKLFERQRDRCCQNDIGSDGTIPEGATDDVQGVISQDCNTGLNAKPFFDMKCNASCIKRIGKDTPIYRRDLKRCVPNKVNDGVYAACVPNKTVCTHPRLRKNFEKACPNACQNMCGMDDLSKNSDGQGYQRVYWQPHTSGELNDDNGLFVTNVHENKTMQDCQALCDHEGDQCHMFEIDNCSTNPNSNDCMGTCTLKRTEDNADGDKLLSLSNRRVPGRTRLYSKNVVGDGSSTDPHLRAHNQRNNYCQQEGRPYYQYKFGGDYDELFNIPRELTLIHELLANNNTIEVYEMKNGNTKDRTLIGNITSVNLTTRPYSVTLSTGQTFQVSKIYAYGPREVRFSDAIQTDKQYLMVYKGKPLSTPDGIIYTEEDEEEESRK